MGSKVALVLLSKPLERRIRISELLRLLAMPNSTGSATVTTILQSKLFVMSPCKMTDMTKLF